MIFFTVMGGLQFALVERDWVAGVDELPCRPREIRRPIAEHGHEEGVSARNLVNDRALDGSQQALLIKLTADAGEIVLVVRQNGQSTFRFISESH